MSQVKTTLWTVAIRMFLVCTVVGHTPEMFWVCKINLGRSHSGHRNIKFNLAQMEVFVKFFFFLETKCNFFMVLCVVKIIINSCRLHTKRSFPGKHSHYDKNTPLPNISCIRHDDSDDFIVKISCHNISYAIRIYIKISLTSKSSDLISTIWHEWINHD